MNIFLKRHFFTIITLLSLGALSSCEETGEEVIVEPGPSITLSRSSATVTAGEAATVDYSVIAESRLEIIRIYRENSLFAEVTDFVNNDSHTATFSYTTNGDEAGTTIEFRFEAEDRQDRVSSETFIVTVEEDIPEIPVATYEATLLGAHNNPNTGSFYDADGNQVYLLAGARENAAAIDFVYYYGATNLATLASPNDPTIEEVLPQIEQFTVRNNTAVRRTDLSSSDFDAIGDTDGIQITNAFDAGSLPTEETRVNELTEGEVFAFQTSDERQGLVRVSDIEGTDAGSITIDVKVISQ